MRRDQTELSYRKAAIQNASAVGLVIILYDMLIADVQAVIEAIELQDVEKRAAELKHGFLVLQELQGLLDIDKGGTAAGHLARFYSVIRAQLLEGHAKSSVEIFQRQIELLLDVRQAWEQVNTPKVDATPAVQSTRGQEHSSSGTSGESETNTWSA